MAETGADKHEPNGKEPKKNGRQGAANEPTKAVMRKVSWQDLRNAKKRPDLRAVIFVDPEEIGLERAEMGYGPLDQIGLVYRPLQDNELPEILDIIRDYDDEDRQREYNDAIVMRCLEDPDVPGAAYLPDTSEGRVVLRTWLTGTRDTIAQAIRTRSGLGLHDVKSAKEALGNLVNSTPNTSSISA